MAGIRSLPALLFCIRNHSLILLHLISVVLDPCMQASNLIYVDQPTGTGFSYTSDDEDIRHDEEGVSNDLYDFLQVLHFPFVFI